MTHLSHLLRADVRRFKLPVAVWLLIQVMDTVYTVMRPGLAADPLLRPAVDLLQGVLWLARWLGLIVLVPLVVQAHPLVGSDAFWMTRPIAWRALLGSKLVLLGTTFVVLPAVFEVVLMAACGVPFAQIGRVSLQTLLFGALLLAVIMAVSAVTRNLSRSALVVGGALVGFVLLINVVIAVLIRSMASGPLLNPVTGRGQPSPTGFVITTLFLIATAGVQIVVQYRTRLTRASIAAGLAGLAVAVLAGAFWPSNQQLLSAPAWAHREAALRFAVASPTGEFSLRQGGYAAASDEWQVGSARLRLIGVEPGWVPMLRLADSTAQFADGTTLHTAENGDSSTVPIESDDEQPAAVMTRHVLGVTRLWPSPGHDRPEAVPTIVVSQSDFNKHEGATATFRGRFLVDLDQIQIVGTLPLHPGAEYRDSRRRLVIDRVVPRSQAVSLLIRQFSAGSVFDADALPGLSLYLRNRVLAEAVTGEEEAMHVSTSMGLPSFFGMWGWGYSQVPGNGFRVTGEFVRFPPYGSDHTGLGLGAAWVSGAELVLVHTVPAGSVTRTVEIPAFEFRPAPPRP